MFLVKTTTMWTFLGKTLPVMLIPTLRPTLTLALSWCYTEHQRYLWNYRSYTITLQHICMRCTQTSGHFTITVNKCQGQRQARGQTESSIQGKIDAVTGRPLTLVRPSETSAHNWLNTNEWQKIVKKTSCSFWAEDIREMYQKVW